MSSVGWWHASLDLLLSFESNVPTGTVVRSHCSHQVAWKAVPAMTQFLSRGLWLEAGDMAQPLWGP